MKFFRRVALGSAVAMVWAFAAGGGSIALATQITVTSTADSGPGSLRDAIAGASAGDTINFNLAYPTTITLTGGPLAINTDLTVSGPGTSNLAINGNNASKIFEIASGATAVIANLSMENGYFGGLCCDDVYTSGGGAVENLGTLTVTAVSITNSLGARGGGINSWGTLTVNDSVIANNTTCCGLAAGGIWNAGTMAVHNSTFIGNSGYYDGGGIFNAGTATVDGSTFLNNQAAHGAGGGIYGGGVTMTITNSTFVGNTAASSGGGIGNGGGTYRGGGTAFIINSTFAGNAAPSGGALANYVSLSVKSSLLSGSTAGGNCFFGSGISTSVGYNLSDDASCAAVLTAMGDLNSTSAGLDPAGLQNNSGPTETIALQPTSLAVDHIPVSACTDINGNPVTTDQRGISRPQGAACDIGAYEYNTNPPTAAACVTPPSGMVSWWPGDGSAKDIIGSNNGTLENGATFGPGAVGQAFSFDGVNQYVDAGNGSSLAVSSGDFTVDAWVKFNTLGGLAGTCPGGGGSNCDMSIADKMNDTAGVNTNGWRLIKQADNHFWFCLGGGFFNGCTPGGPLTVRSNTAVTTGQWYLVAGVKSGNTLSIYVNGSFESSITLGTGFTDTNLTDLLIGANAAEGAYLDGLEDEVELFNRALSPPEIQALYDAGNAGKCKPTATSVSSSANPSVLGQSVTFTATVSVGGSAVVTASGETVTFIDGSTTLGTGTLNSSGQATFATSTLPLGGHSITASYPGDLSLLASTSLPLTQNVTYGICALYDQSKAVNSGAAFPIKVTLCDASGNDVSSPAIVLHATAVMMGSSFVEAPRPVGNANQGDNFRFDSTLGTAGGYIFNLSTSGLPSGTYSLQFTAPGDPETHSVNFGVD